MLEQLDVILMTGLGGYLKLILKKFLFPGWVLHGLLWPIWLS